MHSRRIAPLVFAVASLTAAPAARAGLVLSPLILDLQPGQPPRGDVEMLNSGKEKLYVVVEPARIDNPGRPDERRVQAPDPEVLGLIATPSRVVLEPGQRKFLRLSALKPPGEADRVFRVTVKPVTGDVSGGATGLKLLVGYDMLVIQRPVHPHAEVTGALDGAAMVLSNGGDTNAELFHGRQCSPAGGACTDLPSQRLYAGASVRIDVKPQAKVSYTIKVGGEVSEKTF